MAKKKKLTLLEKQTEARLEELYLQFIKVLKYNPDYWNYLDDRDFQDFKSIIASLEEVRFEIPLLRSIYVPNRPALLADAGSIPEEFFGVAKREVADPILSKVYWRKKLANEIEYCVSEEDPTAALEEKLNCHPELIIDLLIHLLNRFPNKMLPLYWLVNHNAGVMFHLDLLFTDNVIMKAINRHLEFFLSPAVQKTLDPQGWRPQLADGQVLEVIRNPGKGPYNENPESSMLIVSIDFNSGKTKIRKELAELLKKLSPRNTKSTPRFHRDAWEGGYEVLNLYLQELSFEQIAARLGKPYNTVYGLFRHIVEYIHQREWGTKRQRRQESGEEYPFDDDLYYLKDGEIVWKDQFKRGDGKWIGGTSNLDDAEKEIAGRGLLGGAGCGRKAAHIVGRDDEGGTFFNEGMDETWEEAELTRFDNWGRKFGNTNTCMDALPPPEEYTPLIPDGRTEAQKLRDKYIRTPAYITGYNNCKFHPGSERCSTCNQAYPQANYVKGSIEGCTYYKRKALPPIYTNESQNLYREFGEVLIYLISCLIRLKILHEEELRLQSEYIASNGVTKGPWRVAKNFGPRWGWRTQYWPKTKIKCADCRHIIGCDEICEDVQNWVSKNFRPTKKRVNSRQWVHLTGQHSQTFTMSKELLEDLLIKLIDHQKIFTLFQKSIYRRGEQQSAYF